MGHVKRLEFKTRINTVRIRLHSYYNYLKSGGSVLIASNCQPESGGNVFEIRNDQDKPGGYILKALTVKDKSGGNILII